VTTRPVRMRTGSLQAVGLVVLVALVMGGCGGGDGHVSPRSVAGVRPVVKQFVETINQRRHPGGAGLRSVRPSHVDQAVGPARSAVMAGAWLPISPREG